MPTYFSQLSKVEKYLDAAEKVGIGRRVAASRLIHSKDLWSDFQKLYAWASALAPDLPATEA